MYLTTNRNLSDYFAKCFKHCLREKLTVAMGFLSYKYISSGEKVPQHHLHTHYYFDHFFPSLAGSVTRIVLERYVGGRAASQPQKKPLVPLNSISIFHSAFP